MLPSSDLPARDMADDGGQVSTLRASRLDYQPGEPARRRKRRRRAIQAFLGLVLVVLAVWQGPSTYRKLARVYLEQQVRKYVAPPDRVVYEEDPARWSALLAQGGYRNMPSTSPGWNSFVAYTAQPVQRLAGAAELRLGDTAVFAHARRSPSGRERLVVVWLPYNAVRPNAQGATPDNQVQVELQTSVVDGGVMVREDRSAPWIAPQSIARDRQSPLYARFYAGQVDPDDQSHFTLRFEIGEHTDVLDGYLRDGDQVVLRPRNHEHMLNPK